MKRTFSLICATHNAQDKLEATLQSVFVQNKDLFELVVVDNASSDATTNILSRYADEYPSNVRFISEPDSGIFFAFNKAITITEGEYLYFIGVGDTLKPGVLEEIAPHLGHCRELLYGNAYVKSKRTLVGGEMDKYRLCFHNLCHQAIFYHKAVFDKVGHYDTKYRTWSDYALNIKCFGDDSISKRFLDVVMANYEGSGVSAARPDEDFLADRPALVLDNLGRRHLDFYNAAEGNFITQEAVAYAENCVDGSTFGIFGAGSSGVKTLELVNRFAGSEGKQPECRCFFDNNPKLWGDRVAGKRVAAPDPEELRSVDRILIASEWKFDIRSQLLQAGIPAETILIAAYGGP